MNCTFRSIWNETSATFVAVSETAKSAGKKTSSCSNAAGAGARLQLKTLAAAMMVSIAGNAFALPSGGAVTAGGASITTGAGNTTINQTTQSAAINWQSFNISAGETVLFKQPNSTSVILNRVLGADPSSILGSMTANGKVFLVNPNGILFGKGASVNVGGLVASTLNITDSDFMAGNYKFSGASQGSVQNQGSISAAGGFVALLGANVSNDGLISAQLGTVALAAGNAITLDVAGDGLLNVTVDQGAVNALVQNGGLIQADGGNVLLTAKAAGTLLQSAVNNTGVIQAQTIANHNGTIRLLGDMQIGTVTVGGRLDAAAPNGGDGGFIETSAARVKVADGVNITTHAAQGKTGTWLIDPVDFTIAVGGDITPAQLAIDLASNITISSTGGVSGTLGDINVNNDVTWGAATTLTLNAVHDVNFNANVTTTTGNLVANAGHDVNVNAMAGTGITMTTTGGNMTWTAGNDIWVKAGVAGGITATGTGPSRANVIWTAGRDIKIDSAVTTTDANFTACCGRDIVITGKMTTTRGNVVLKAGNDGSGVGVAGVGGTVVLPTGILAYTVTGPASEVSLYYTPTSYSSAHDYSSNFILSGGATGPTSGAPFTGTYMLVFAKGNDKVYDGNTDATLSFNGDPTAGGINDVTLVKLVSGAATFADKNVAPNIGITYSGYTLGGADAAKFALWQSCLNPLVGTTSAAITPRSVTIKADDATKVYGQTFTPANTAFTVPVPPLAGETITSVNEATPGTPGTVPVATYLITPSNAAGATFNPANYTITYQTGNLVVTPAPLTVTANDNTKVYGQSFAPASTAFTTSALQNGETVGSVTETSPAGTPTTAAAPGPYVITPSAATGGTFAPGNYTISYVNGALTVTPAPLTVTANDNTKVYGQTFTPAGTAFTTTGLQNSETVGSVTETSPAGISTIAAAPGPYAITPSAATGGTFAPGNYTISYVNGALTVTPAPLTVTANDSTKTFGQTPILTGFTTTPLANGETIGSVTETSPGSVDTASVAGSPYAITPSGATGGTFTPGNYTIAYNNGVLTVTPAVVTPIVSPPVDVPPIETPPIVSPPVRPITWVPVVTQLTTPPELLTLVPPALIVPPVPEVAISPPAPAPVFVPTPIVTPVAPPPAPYVAPVHLRKQDRN